MEADMQCNPQHVIVYILNHILSFRTLVFPLTSPYVFFVHLPSIIYIVFHLRRRDRYRCTGHSNGYVARHGRGWPNYHRCGRVRGAGAGRG